jgi:hypothetical protein
LNRPGNDEKPCASKAEPAKPQTEAFLSKALSNKDLKRTSPPEIVPTTLFGKMKSLLSSTIGDRKLARNFYGVYRKQSLQMLKFSIHENKGDLFEQLAMQALRISIQTTKLKKVRNLPGYYSGVLRELIDKALFSEAFMDYDVPFEGFFYR